MATTRYETATTIINDAAVELGLPSSTNPFASTDANMVRLVRLLSGAGRELVQIYQWPHLRKVCDITAATGDGRAWTLPADFAGLVPDTAWNQTTDERITGPMSAAQWQEYEAEGDTPLSPMFRVTQGVFAVVPTASVTDGDLLQYEYHGKSWVMPTGQTVPTEDRVSATTDTVWFDPLLAKIALKRAWMTANSMDTSAIESAYWQAIDRVKGLETPAAPLSLVPTTTLPLPTTTEGNWTV